MGEGYLAQGVPWHCSAGVQAPPSTTRTPSVFCSHQGWNQEPSTPQPSLITPPIRSDSHQVYLISVSVPSAKQMSHCVIRSPPCFPWGLCWTGNGCCLVSRLLEQDLPRLPRVTTGVVETVGSEETPACPKTSCIQERWRTACS